MISEMSDSQKELVAARMISNYWAAIPGAGHLVLKKYRYLFLFLPLYAAFFLIMKFGDRTTGICTISSFFLLLALMFAVSIIDTVYQCDLMKYPYYNASCRNWYEFHIKNFRLTYRLWILIPSILGIIFSVLSLLFDGYTLYTLSVLIMWCVIGSVGVILVHKFRNIKRVN